MPQTGNYHTPRYGDIDFSWMLERKITDVIREAYHWDFVLGPRLYIRAECPWRIIRDRRIRVSSDDHGQMFGLPTPLDAAKTAAELLREVAVSRVQISEAVGDLLIDFSEGLRLAVIPLSSGYESWQWTDPAGYSYSIQGGGTIVRDRVPGAGQS